MYSVRAEPKLPANISRRYYERELGAGLGPSPSLKEHFGYSEPLRRFIQRESFEPQANEIPNTMPSWLPGEDYMTNFKKGDPYVRVDDGYARLPGAGYEALHPELKGVNPEDYPDIHKLRILADVAPYSREYNQVSPSCLTQKTLAHARQAQTPCRIRIRISLSPGLLPALPFYRGRARGQWTIWIARQLEQSEPCSIVAILQLTVQLADKMALTGPGKV